MQYDTVDIMNGNSLKLQDVIRGLPLVEGKNPTGIPLYAFWDDGLHGGTVFHFEN